MRFRDLGPHNRRGETEGAAVAEVQSLVRKLVRRRLRQLERRHKRAGRKLNVASMQPSAVSLEGACSLLSALCSLLSFLSCVLCAVCCVLCAVCCVLCAVCCVLCVVCCVLCAVRCVLCATYTPFPFPTQGKGAVHRGFSRLTLCMSCVCLVYFLLLRAAFSCLRSLCGAPSL